MNQTITVTCKRCGKTFQIPYPTTTEYVICHHCKSRNWMHEVEAVLNLQEKDPDVKTIPVNEVYYGTMPGGKDVGIPCAIIRLQGCNVECHGCIPSGAIDTTSGSNQSITKIHEKISKWKLVKRVLITGGEPTIHPQLPDLIRYLISKEYHVTLATNGMKYEKELAEMASYILVDIKMIGTNVAQDVDQVKLYITNHYEKVCLNATVMSKPDVETAVEFFRLINRKLKGLIDFTITPFRVGAGNNAPLRDVIIKEIIQSGIPIRVISGRIHRMKEEKK